MLPCESVTLKLNGDPNKVLSNHRADNEGTIQDWFGGNIRAELYEEAIGLGPYGKTLTVPTINDFPDAEALEDEEQLKESWTPRFRR